MNNADEIYGTLLNTPIDPDKFGGGGGGGSVSDEKIAAAVEEYMAENPVTDGVGISYISTIVDNTTEQPATVISIRTTDGKTETFRIPHGKDGGRGVSGVYVGSGEMPDGYNLQIDPNGEVLTLAYFSNMIQQAIEAYDTEAMSLLGVDEDGDIV